MNDGSTRQLSADLIFINAGARPSMPRLEGIDGVPYLNSTTIMELDAVPEHLLVIGGGYIGLEFGQLFRRLGSRVTIVQRGSKLLAREDADVADAVAEILRQDGIELLLDSEAPRVEHAADGAIHLTVRGGGQERVIAGSHLLVAAGRTPNSDSLNLAAAGVQSRQARLHPGQRAAGNECARHLRARRHQGWPGLHAHLLRRFSDHPQQPDRRRQRHDQSSAWCPTPCSSIRSWGAWA